MTEQTNKSPDNWRKIFVVWAIIALLSILGMSVLYVYKERLIDSIQRTHPNPAIVAQSLINEAEVYHARALAKVQERKDKGQPPELPADDPDVNKALELLDKAYILQMDLSELLYMKADLYGMSGRLTEQSNAMGHYYLSWRNDERNPKLAYEMFERAASQDPDNLDHRLGMVKSLLAMGEWDKARWQALEIEESNPGTARNAYYIAQIIKHDGNIDEAITWLEKAVEKKPDFVEAIKLLTLYYDQTNQLDKSIALYERSIEYIPYDASLFHMKGQVYMATGDLDNALKSFKDAYKINPNSISLVRDLIIVNAKMNNDAAVRFYTNRALDLDPSFVLKTIERATK
jgi:tetratricopeptide (TPR) repeat protein